MSLVAWFRSHLARLFHNQEKSSEIDEEILAHIALRADDLERSGIERAAAERRACIEFGARERYREEILHTLRGTLLRTLLQDIHFSLRLLRNSPGFSLAVVISLALGIGATTSVFSVIYVALIHPFPYRSADRIFVMGVRDKAGEERGIDLSVPQISLLRKSPVVEDLFAMQTQSLTTTGGDFPEDVEAALVTPNTFDFLGIPPLLGRSIEPFDAVDGQKPKPVVVLSYKFWQRRFNSDPDAVGQTLRLDGKAYRIIGVAGPQFTWYRKDVYLPLEIDTKFRTDALRISPLEAG